MSPVPEVLAADPRLFQATRCGGPFWSSEADRAPDVRLFGLRMANLSLEAAVSDLLAAAAAGTRTQAVFVNAHVVNTMAADPVYAGLVAGADLHLVDGSGMAIAARMAGQRFVANTNGTDLFPLLCKAAAGEGRRIFLLGGRHGVAARAAETIRAAGHGAAIAGTHHGYLFAGSPEEAEALLQIERSRADILLVGLGVPLQEQWIARNQARITVPVTAGVGGLFDFFAGNFSRAPHVVRAAGMEWAWRLAQEPSRLWQRYLVGNVTFLARAAVEAARYRSARQRPLNRPATSGAVQ